MMAMSNPCLSRIEGLRIMIFKLRRGLAADAARG